MSLQFEVLQANDGDCLLLQYGDGELILIDGGPAGIYSKVLKGRLEQLRAGSEQLDLRLVMVSHIDADHITGIVDLFKSLAEKQSDGESPKYRIRSLWHNSFKDLSHGHKAAVESGIVAASLDGTVPEGLCREVAAVVASVPQGNSLRVSAAQLGIPINAETDGGLVKAPGSGKKLIKIADKLIFTILGPHQTELDELEASWKRAKEKGTAKPESIAADYLNRTVPNLSSIVVLAEFTATNPPVRMLLTGDAGGDLILKGLRTAGLLDGKGMIHVDLLKVQHHGSSHSVDPDFFKKVTADRYVISGNGKHGIPHRDVLTWLSQARAGEGYDVYMTNREGEKGLTAMLDSFLAEEAVEQPKHRYHFCDGISIPINLAG